MREKHFSNEIKREFNKYGRLHRLNKGIAWMGKKIQLKNGDILIKNPTVVNFNFATGASDLIGYTIMEIAGKKVAVFTAVEVKTQKEAKKRDKRYYEQMDFINRIKEHGGIAVMTTESFEPVKKEIDKFKHHIGGK